MPMAVTNPTIAVGLDYSETPDAYKVTLRDLFAAAALAGMGGRVCIIDEPWAATENDRVAVGAYRIADAMLRAREPR